jgi:hypothetical protein
MWEIVGEDRAGVSRRMAAGNRKKGFDEERAPARCV